MSIGIPTLAWTYVTVFLAVVFIAWLIFAWQRRRLRRNSQRICTCPHCGERLHFRQEMVFVRCANCGARIKLGKLIKD